MERMLGWLPWLSLGTLKLAFNTSSDEQGSHAENLSISVIAFHIFVDLDNGLLPFHHQGII